MENLKIDDLKNIHGGSNENLDGAKSWLNKQHNRLWESVGAGIAQQGNPEGWKNKTGGLG
ncbi:hypothetical protein [Staphylococcus equorum]|uniref:hypothetical protein n=1 Tax=Staphylococcus equorum TaxID=246432 RepID=UPI001867BF01|nr:hypothetical protein [Staphylococcus equorum]